MKLNSTAVWLSSAYKLEIGGKASLALSEGDKINLSVPVKFTDQHVIFCLKIKLKNTSPPP